MASNVTIVTTLIMAYPKKAMPIEKLIGDWKYVERKG